MHMHITLEALQVLDAIATKGSFAAAAESLHRVPSAITYTVRRLEDDLGISLFDRSGHRAELTDAGAELLREGRHMLRAAEALQSRVKRVATGIETDLSIAVSDLFRMESIHPILHKFYEQGFGTRIRLLSEVFGGSWDALVAGRADISLGAPGDGPAGGGYSTRLIGSLIFHFVVTPDHPLAASPEPLHNCDILQYRSISAADTSRNLQPRTSGILTGQDVLTVPRMQDKLQAQLNGLGVGYLPKNLAERYAATGELVIKQVAEAKSEGPIFMAWRTGGGKAQNWLVKEFEKLSIEELMP